MVECKKTWCWRTESPTSHAGGKKSAVSHTEGSLSTYETSKRTCTIKCFPHKVILTPIKPHLIVVPLWGPVSSKPPHCRVWYALSQLEVAFFGHGVNHEMVHFLFHFIVFCLFCYFCFLVLFFVEIWNQRCVSSHLLRAAKPLAHQTLTERS